MAKVKSERPKREPCPECKGTGDCQGCVGGGYPDCRCFGDGECIECHGTGTITVGVGS